MRDIRLAIRRFRKAPAFVSSAVLTMAVGIGATVSIFAAYSAVLLKPISISDPDRLAVMWETDAEAGTAVREVSYRNFADWRDQTRSFAGVAAFSSAPRTMLLENTAGPTNILAVAVSKTFFEVLGAQPVRGRSLVPDDDRPGAPRVALMSDMLWRQRFSADPAIVGRSIRLDRELFTVVGVMPSSFRFPREALLWTALVPDLVTMGQRFRVDALEARHFGVLNVVGRLRPDVELTEARTELDTIARGLPRAMQAASGSQVVIKPLLDHMFGQTRRTLDVLFATVGLVLLLACANVSGLLLSRATVGSRDTALKIALGATRGRLFRESLAEMLVLVLIAGVIGVLIAQLVLYGTAALAPKDIPRLENVSIDSGVLAFAVLMSALTSLLCSVGPVTLASPNSMADALISQRNTGGGRVRRISRALVVVEIAMAMILLVGAGLLVRSVINVRQLDLGFQPENVLTLDVQPVVETTAEWRAAYDAMLDRIVALPGVQAAGAVYLRPLAHGPVGLDSGVVLQGQSFDRMDEWINNPKLNFQTVTPGYFDSVRIRLIKGRLFTLRDDDEASRAAILSESAAERLWPGQDPIGKQLSAASGVDRQRNILWQTVVGVVSDVRYRGIDDVRLDMYMPAAQAAHRVKHVMIRTAGEPLAVLPAVRSTIQSTVSHAVIEQARTMSDVVDSAMAPWRFGMLMFGGLAITALILAVVGLFGLVSYSVSHRRSEIAVRLALGAKPGRLIANVVGEGSYLALAGVLAGGVISLLLTRRLSSLLFHVGPRDVGTFVTVAVTLVVVVLLASYVAARRILVIRSAAALQAE
jgi:putative ABC transport system permease protein